MPNLFDPVNFGFIRCANRVVMAPLTRGRAGPSRIPNDMMAEYYAQRAGAGLIVAEATAISAIGYGWANAPGIHDGAHVAGWRNVTDAVHERGGKIVLQLWHMGRLSHPDFHSGQLPVAPSPIRGSGKAHTPEGEKDYIEPRALSIDEIASTVGDYAAAARRAMDAGFDGVEIHGANGYLIDQFLKDGANRRDDIYGGGIENRCRFALETVTAVCDAIGADKTGLRLSPNVPNGGISDSHSPALFDYLATVLNPFDLAFVHIHEGLRGGTRPAPWVSSGFRKAYDGNLILNGGYDRTTAMAAVENAEADAVAFGKAYIANPDLAERLEKDAPLNTPNPATFYTDGRGGYLDYPALTG